MNPEPLADYFDLFDLGDGEELLPEIMEAYSIWKKSGLPRIEFLREAAKIEGVYVPSFYEPVYNDEGLFKELRIKDEFRDAAKIL